MPKRKGGMGRRVWCAVFGHRPKEGVEFMRLPEFHVVLKLERCDRCNALLHVMGEREVE